MQQSAWGVGVHRDAASEPLPVVVFGVRVTQEANAAGEARQREPVEAVHAQVAARERGLPREVLIADRVAGPAAARASGCDPTKAETSCAAVVTGNHAAVGAQRVRRRPPSLKPLPRRTRSGGRLLPRAAIGVGRGSSPGRRLGATPGRRLRRPGHAIGECRRRGQAARTSSGRARPGGGARTGTAARGPHRGPGSLGPRCRRGVHGEGVPQHDAVRDQAQGAEGLWCGGYSSRSTVSGERRAARMAAVAAMTRPRTASAATTPR